MHRPPFSLPAASLLCLGPLSHIWENILIRQHSSEEVLAHSGVEGKIQAASRHQSSGG